MVVVPFGCPKKQDKKGTVTCTHRERPRVWVCVCVCAWFFASWLSFGSTGLPPCRGGHSRQRLSSLAMFSKQAGKVEKLRHGHMFSRIKVYKRG